MQDQLVFVICICAIVYIYQSFLKLGYMRTLKKKRSKMLIKQKILII